jgi:hypothetical protein
MPEGEQHKSVQRLLGLHYKPNPLFGSPSHIADLGDRVKAVWLLISLVGTL